MKEQKIDESVNILSPTKIHQIAGKSVEWLVDILVKYHIEPNIITVIAVVSAICAGVFFGLSLWLPAVFLVLSNGIFDIIDGQLSKKLSNRPKHLQELGVFLDPAGDRLSDTALFLGLIYYAISRYPAEFSLLIVGTLAAHLSSSWIRAKVESLGLRFHRKKSFTRATLQVALLIICLGMHLVGSRLQYQFFFYTVLFLICIPKIGTLCAWLRRAIIKITTGRHAGVFS